MEHNVATFKGKAHGKAILHLSRLKAMGCHHDPKISKIMLETDVRATLLFGSVTWGPYGLKTDPMDHIMQTPYSILPRRAHQLPHGTAHWIVSMLSGLLPIQHWILRNFCRMWNKLLELQHTHAPLYKGHCYNNTPS